MSIDIVQFALLLALMAGLVVVAGRWLTRVLTAENHWLPERLGYRLLGVDPSAPMDWKRYGIALVLSNAAMMLLGYAILRIQAWLPFDALQRPAQTPDLAFNTAASFVTNTNWQSYSGESSLSNFSQMAAITFLMTVSAASGIAGCAAFIRGLAQREARDVGNYWADFSRITWRLLLPLCLALSLVYVWQGIPQTLASSTDATTLEGATQHIVVGPVASLEAIKHIGTNGGGFYGVNAAHPFEDPTPLTNLLHMLAMFLVPSALTYAFGRMLSRRRQGWAFLAAFVVMFVGFLSVEYPAERHGNPMFTSLSVDQAPGAMQPGGNMEGKEMRFGIAQTSAFVAVTTAATTGSVNAMHDSLTPLGGMVPLFLMMLNDVFGGVGVGFINLVSFAILTVFLVGMMIGRTPEFLGKKIEAREIKLVMLAVLAHPFCILGFTALAAMWPGASASFANAGPHGFSELIYAYTSGTANNGSAFAGLNANTPFYNTTIGLAMLMGRYFTLLPMLAVAGSLATKRSIPESLGTLPTATPLFTCLLIFVIVVVGGLTFLPALALGPIVEQLAMTANQFF
jgi:potassium-transporting ATPase potassium-binding subunit